MLGSANAAPNLHNFANLFSAICQSILTWGISNRKRIFFLTVSAKDIFYESVKKALQKEQ